MKILLAALLALMVSTGAQAAPTNSVVKVGQVRNAYASVNVTTSAYVQLVASMASEARLIEVFDSSGQTLILGVGGAGSEVVQLYIVPGGNGLIPLDIPTGSRVAIKALSGTASTGEIDVNFYY